MQNKSNAVMATRIEPADSLDDFPTQPWATRALIEHVLLPFGFDPKIQRVWEPACNRGHMVKPLKEYFGSIVYSDIHDYGEMFFTPWFIDNFLTCEPPEGAEIDWVITNPPFRLAKEFLLRSQALGIPNYAMIVRTAYLEGGDRYRQIFQFNPPTIVAQFVERVPMVKGRLTKKGSTATAYCWLVWCKWQKPRLLQWIPPCRKELERDSDYE